MKVKLVDKMIQSDYLCVFFFTCQALKTTLNGAFNLIPNFGKIQDCGMGGDHC